jgi:hypothetical protein
MKKDTNDKKSKEQKLGQVTQLRLKLNEIQAPNEYCGYETLFLFSTSSSCPPKLFFYRKTHCVKFHPTVKILNPFFTPSLKKRP